MFSHTLYPRSFSSFPSSQSSIVISLSISWSIQSFEPILISLWGMKNQDSAVYIFSWNMLRWPHLPHYSRSSCCSFVHLKPACWHGFTKTHISMWTKFLLTWMSNTYLITDVTAMLAEVLKVCWPVNLSCLEPMQSAVSPFGVPGCGAISWSTLCLVTCFVLGHLTCWSLRINSFAYRCGSIARRLLQITSLFQCFCAEFEQIVEGSCSHHPPPFVVCGYR